MSWPLLHAQFPKVLLGGGDGGALSLLAYSLLDLLEYLYEGWWKVLFLLHALIYFSFCGGSKLSSLFPYQITVDL